MSLYALEQLATKLRQTIQEEIQKKQKLEQMNVGDGVGPSDKLVRVARSFVSSLRKVPSWSAEFTARAMSEREESQLSQGTRFLEAVVDRRTGEHEWLVELIGSNDEKWRRTALAPMAVAVESLLEFAKRQDADEQLGKTGGGASSTPVPNAKPPKAAADDIVKRLETLERQTKKPPKTPTKTERIRDQRIKFCCPKRRKKSQDSWNKIYHAYNQKYSDDKDASPGSLRLSHDRNCPKRPKCLSEKKRS